MSLEHPEIWTRRLNFLFAELHVRERLRNMRVVMSVTVPGPAGAGLQLAPRAIELLEARTVDAPDVAVARRQCAPVRQPAQSFPGQRQLHRPARRSYFHRVPQPRIIPIQEAPALAARMHVPAHPVEHHRPLRGGIELRPPKIRTTLHQRVLPDPEDLVDRIERVDLEFVV